MTTLEIILIVALLLSWAEYIRVILNVRKIRDLVVPTLEYMQQLREDALELVEAAAVLEQERNK